jgi:hypothetical protein
LPWSKRRWGGNRLPPRPVDGGGSLYCLSFPLGT